MHLYKVKQKWFSTRYFSCCPVSCIEETHACNSKSVSQLLFWRKDFGWSCLFVPVTMNIARWSRIGKDTSHSKVHRALTPLLTWKPRHFHILSSPFIKKYHISNYAFRCNPTSFSTSELLNSFLKISDGLFSPNPENAVQISHVTPCNFTILKMTSEYKKHRSLSFRPIKIQLVHTWTLYALYQTGFMTTFMQILYWAGPFTGSQHRLLDFFGHFALMAAVLTLQVRSYQSKFRILFMICSGICRFPPKVYAN